MAFISHFYSYPPYKYVPTMSATVMLLWILVIIFIAHFINSAFGFGDSLVSVPLLTLFLPLEEVTPFVAILSITTNVVIVLNDFKNVKWRSITILFFSALLTIPLGIYIGSNANPVLVKLALVVLIVSFSIYNLFAPKLIHLKNSYLAPLFGGLSGIFGGAYNITGPPVVLYGSLRRWQPEKFRVTTQAYFFATTLFIVLNYWKKGAYTPNILNYFFYSIPVMLIAVFIGKWANRKIKDPVRFNKYVYLLMLILAGVLVAGLF